MLSGVRVLRCVTGVAQAAFPDATPATASSTASCTDSSAASSGCASAKRGLRPLYLDMQSTTPLDPRVLDRMLPYMTEQYGNPHSRTHSYGWAAEAAVEKARAQVADLIGANAKGIIFTSGATESNNIAIKGVANYNKGVKNHVVTLQTEHKCVLDSCRYLEMDGFEVTYLPVEKNGLVNLQKLDEAIRPTTALVSCMYVNNEIGVIQPIREIGEICKRKKVFFHTDAAQALGKVPIDVELDNIDLMSLSSHKVYGPKGCGALYMRRRPRVRVRSPISGGGQERGVRSGTVATPLVVGFGAACEIAKQEMARDTQRITRLSARLLDGLKRRLSHITVNGDIEKRYPGNLNISIACVEGESLLMGMKSVALSSGSACTSASLEPSYVLRALGIDAENAHTSIRFGIGRFTTEREIDVTIEECVRTVERLREMSPLWDLLQEGKGLSDVEWR
ncbi:putative Aminotransferase class V Beta eliminating lyase [Trypanosoma vivax]|nr:Cysteine desulfurase, mitochondrial [Trypanosoma vivax]KAH8618980.1 putative Aminotransferase class V Beta eliminating lyase [Trypanosoma vivax]